MPVAYTSTCILFADPLKQPLVSKPDCNNNEYKTLLNKCKSIKLCISLWEDDQKDEENTDALLSIMHCIKSPFLEKVIFQGWASMRRTPLEITALLVQLLARNPTIKQLFYGIVIHDDEFLQTSYSEETALKTRVHALLGKLLTKSKFISLPNTPIKLCPSRIYSYELFQLS